MTKVFFFKIKRYVKARMYSQDKVVVHIEIA